MAHCRQENRLRLYLWSCYRWSAILNWIYRLVIGAWVDVDTRGKSRICMVKFVKNRIAIVIWRIQRGTVVEIANSQERISLMVPLKRYDLQLNIYFAVE